MMGEKLALVDTGQPVHEDLEGVGFAMKDGEKLIGVLVTHEALDDIESPPPAEGEYTARCEAYRDQFATIASQKYAAGNTERAGARVRITTSDISN
jgi:hypothetical protein